MLDFVSNVWSGEVVEEPFERVEDFDLLVIFLFVFPFDEGFVEVFGEKRFDERSHLFFLLKVMTRISY